MVPVRAYAPNIRLQQHRARADLTQEAVAEELATLAWVHHGIRVGINADMVGKWERGEKRPSKLYRRLLCLLYQASEEQLGFRTPVATEQLAVTGSDVNRRAFLRNGALLGAAMLTPADWLDTLDGSETGDRLAWALQEPSRVDLATTADMEAVAAAYAVRTGNSRSRPCSPRRSASSRPSPNCCNGLSPLPSANAS